MSAAMLELEGVESYYGVSQALFGVSFKVSEGEVVSLLGRNGAGKSTTLKTIMGLVTCNAGRISYCGNSIRNAPTHRIAAAGIAMVVEDRRIFSLLSVEENLKISVSRKSPWRIPDVYRMFPCLEERRKNGGAKLSGGEQQMLAIARALLSGPSMLFLDEPTEGLAPVIVEQITSNLAEIKKSGMTIVLVEQNLAMCAALADRHLILEEGSLVYEGTTEEFRCAVDIKERFLGVATGAHDHPSPGDQQRIGVQ